MTVQTLRARPGAVRTALLFAGRDFKVAISYRLPFVLTILGTLMSLITFRFIGELVGDAEAIRATGDYFAFVVVGMVLAHVLDGMLSAPASAARQEQMQGTLEVLATQPIRASGLAAGWIAYPLVDATLTGLGIMAVAVPLGFRVHDPNWLAALPALALSGVVFGAMGMLAAAMVVVLQQGANATRWLAGGMSLISGVFFPVELLPRWLALIAEASPLTHAVRALRGALLQGRSATDLAPELLALLAAAAVLVPLGVAVLAFGLRRARSRGTISSY